MERKPHLGSCSGRTVQADRTGLGTDASTPGTGDTPSYKVGDRVCLATQDIKNNQGSHKLNLKYFGLYQIRHQINKVTYELASPCLSHIHHAFHVS